MMFKIITHMNNVTIIINCKSNKTKSEKNASSCGHSKFYVTVIILLFTTCHLLMTTSSFKKVFLNLENVLFTCETILHPLFQWTLELRFFSDTSMSFSIRAGEGLKVYSIGQMYLGFFKPILLSNFWLISLSNRSEYFNMELG